MRSMKWEASFSALAGLEAPRSLDVGPGDGQVGHQGEGGHHRGPWPRPSPSTGRPPRPLMTQNMAVISGTRRGPLVVSGVRAWRPREVTAAR